MNQFNKTSFFFLILIEASLSAYSQFDIQPTHNGPVQYLTPGSYPLTFSARNLDWDYPVSYFESHWQLDGGEIHSCVIQSDDLLHYPLLYPMYLSSSFVHCDALSLTEPGYHQLKVWTAMPEGMPDANPANDTLYSTIFVAQDLPDKKIMVFLGTHVDCFPCGGLGEEQQNLLLQTYPEQVIMSVMHGDVATDPFDNEESEAFNDLYIWPMTGHPAFLFDLFKFPFFYDIISSFYWSQTDAVSWRLPYRSPLEVSFENTVLNEDAGTVSGDLRIKFFAPYEGPLSVNVILSEDSIWWYQNGYPLGDSLYHRFVMRDMTGGVTGDNSVLPQSIAAGEEFIYHFETSVQPDWNVNQLYLAGYVQKVSANVMESDIWNAAQLRLTETVVSASSYTTHQSKLLVSPNPAHERLYISYQGEGTSLELYNTQGALVMKLAVSPGGFNRQFISVSALPAGVYRLTDTRDSSVSVIITH